MILFFGEKIYSNILNQLFIFFIPIIWPGIAHGSLDILTATRKKLIIDSFTKFIFLILYLMIPLVFFFYLANLSELCIHGFFDIVTYAFWDQ